MKAQNHHF